MALNPTAQMQRRVDRTHRCDSNGTASCLCILDTLNLRNFSFAAVSCVFLCAPVNDFYLLFGCLLGWLFHLFSSTISHPHIHTLSLSTCLPLLSQCGACRESLVRLSRRSSHTDERRTENRGCARGQGASTRRVSGMLLERRGMNSMDNLQQISVLVAMVQFAPTCRIVHVQCKFSVSTSR